MTPLSAPSDYGLALAMAVGVALLLLLPGLCWNACFRPRRRLPSAFVPLPGLLMLSATGVLIWLTHGLDLPVADVFVLVPEGVMALVVIWRLSAGNGAGLFGEQGLSAFIVWAVVVVGAAALGVNPLPVAQESYVDSVIPARMVASPPDHITPYQSAAYLDHGYDGRVRSDDYFGADWSLASRGPLVPLAITTLFHLFGAQTSDTPNLAPTAWPVTSEGAFLARILGWLTNGLVVLGVGHLLAVLKIGRRTRVVGLIWTGLAPFVLINTVYLWPKLLCGFFVLMTTAAIIESSWIVAGACFALAALSHPSGLLFLPGLGAMLVWRAFAQAGSARERVAAIAGASCIALVTAFLFMAPWLAYKAWLNTHDHFLDYLLADGMVPRAADSLRSWLRLRWSNLWFTVVPGAFYFSDNMQIWTEGRVSEPLRWTIQYAKSLPAELGFCSFMLAYAALLWPGRRPVLRMLAWPLILGTLAVMIVCWGFSGDGLGRNSLEPLAPLVIVLAVVAIRPPSWIWCLVLTGLWLEGRWVEAAGFVWAQGFAWDQVPPAAWLAFIVSSGTGLGLVVWLWREWALEPRAAQSGGPPMPRFAR